MGDVLVLWHFRSKDPNCQSFDKYVSVPRGSSFAQAFNEAVDVLYQFFEGVNQSGDFRKRVCDPAGYDIIPGPNLNEAL